MTYVDVGIVTITLVALRYRRDESQFVIDMCTQGYALSRDR